MSYLPIFEFHISRTARKKYNIDTSLFAKQGRLVFANFNSARELSAQLNKDNLPVSASELNAFGLMDEVIHLLFEYYLTEIDAGLFTELIASLQKSVTKSQLDQVLSDFINTFPPEPVFKEQLDAENFLKSQQNREQTLEELILLWLENRNPSYSIIDSLVGEKQLSRIKPYHKLFGHIESFFKEQTQFGENNISFLDFLRIPALKYPNSIMAQFEYVAEKWAPYLGEILSRLLISIDFIREEQIARFDPAVFGPGPTHIATFGEDYDYEPERFSQDSDWMPHVVLMAKSTYVWLDQLGKQYQKSISRLDQIPDEELDRLSAAGFTGLWLIGLWQRSLASQKIKQISGNPEAVSSAYSLHDYQIAEDLGGESAYINLKDRAAQRGIRLASDMVPNHMGLDSRWVVEHPDWFIQSDHSPFPSYTFNGPDLSTDERVGIFIEDGYWNKSDAAVVFKRWDRHTGSVKYVYHGNDGTTMPWNDTAQLNYLIPEVREAVIQTILHVARKFPIIRFDAAMTLAKKHFQRLWFPEPGHGGDIPSRAEHSLTKDRLNELFPEEFWRDVVDRVQAEVPNTLLLAEAFWMMEGYFVRSLGMHRVYNSAFMNMLKNEENYKYRISIKNVLEFNPQILKRYVNFMNNPDEETAAAQFGKDDKYFGICLMMSTMPGLPMFGHGQIEGFSEKYGMEYKRAYWDETIDEHLVQRHQREIFPLLKKRYLFSEVQNFLLYDFYTSDGLVNENVFAYSNRVGSEAALILYNNKFEFASGWINQSVAFLENGALNQKTISDGLHLENSADKFLIFKNYINGLEYIRSVSEIYKSGLYFELEAFKYQVYGNFRIVHHTKEQPYGLLFEELHGEATLSVNDALAELPFRPLLEALNEAINPGSLDWLLSEAHPETFIEKLDRINGSFDAYPGSKKLSPRQLAKFKSDYLSLLKLQTKRSVAVKNLDKTFRQTSLILLFVRAMNAVYAQSKSPDLAPFFDHRLYTKQVFRSLSESKISIDDISLTTELIQIGEGAPELVKIPTAGPVKAYLENLFAHEIVFKFLLVNRYNNILYFNQERFESLLDWLFVLSIWIGGDTASLIKTKLAIIARLKKLALESGYQLYNFIRLGGKNSS